MKTPAFALIGRSHPSDTFELLYQASLIARAERRAMERAGRAVRAPMGRPSRSRPVPR